MDEITFKQLKESKYHHPEITEVMFDYDMMLEMAYHSMTIVEKSYETIWDSNMLYFTMKYFREGMDFVEKLVKERGIKMRIIIQTTKENIDYLSQIDYLGIRCLDDIKGNFGIFDNRAYMVYIFHRNSDKPDQTLWSNSKALVGKQQALFEKLWEIAVPLSMRRKEIEYEDASIAQRTITDFDKIRREIESLILTCKKELTIFSSNRILCYLLNKSDFLNYLPALSNRETSIKILTDKVDNYLTKQAALINHSNQTNPIELRYTNKIGQLNEMVMIFDNKLLLRLNYNQDNILIATFSNEEHTVLVQELMFEKYWNEVKSLEVMNSN